MITFNQINAYRPYMLSVAIRFGASEDDAQDIVQDVLIKLFERGQVQGYDFMTYNDQPNKGYLFVLTKNLTITHLRRDNKSVTLSANIERTMTHEDDSLPDWKKACQIAFKSFCNLYTEIHFYDYQIAYLYYFENMSLRKLSKETGISVYSILNTINNVKDKFKEAYDKECEIFQKDESGYLNAIPNREAPAYFKSSKKQSQ